MLQKKGTAANEILLLLYEDKIRDDIKRRTDDQVAQIKKQRLISSIISSFVILFGWVLIYIGSVKEKDIQDWTR